MEPAPDGIVVVGGGIAGMAAAARLAKAGHRVTVYERRDRLGGSWAAFPLAAEGSNQPDPVLVDTAPGALNFPAPWRDLLRKSGRTFDAELTRAGLALSPAPPATYTFADGTAISLPTDRGEQYEALVRTFGAGPAQRWRDLLDGLDDVWQQVRTLGSELELYDHRQLTRAVRGRLLADQTVADLADQTEHPHLRALIRQVAYQRGSVPELTPAFVAVELAVVRTFGRWMMTSRTEPDAPLRISRLTEVIVERLTTRKVAVRSGAEVTALRVAGGRVRGVEIRTAAGAQQVVATRVIVAVDPWSTADLLRTPGLPLRDRTARLRRGVRRLQPAAAPTVSHVLVDGRPAELAEQVTLTSDGVPVISWTQQSGDTWVRAVHDYRQTVPRRAAGAAWQGFDSWLDRPGATTDVEGLFTASPASRGGNHPSQLVLSAALASYACHDSLL